MNAIKLVAPALVLALLTGCGTAVAPATMTLRAIEAKGAAAKAPGARREAPTTAATTRLAKDGSTGGVQVAFASLGEATRRLMSVGDVDYVEVLLTDAIGRMDHRSLDRQALRKAKPAVTFDRVLVGKARLEVLAYDASGTYLGSGSAEATIEKNRTAEVALKVGLEAAGSLAAKVTFDDNFVPTQMPTPAWGHDYPAPPPPAYPGDWSPAGPWPSPAPLAGPSVQPAAVGSPAAGSVELTGHLTDRGGNPTPFATVGVESLDADKPYQRYLEADSTGAYRFSDLPAGARLMITATRGHDYTMAVRVLHADEVLDLALTSDSTPTGAPPPPPSNDQ